MWNIISCGKRLAFTLSLSTWAMQDSPVGIGIWLRYCTPAQTVGLGCGSNLEISAHYCRSQASTKAKLRCGISYPVESVLPLPFPFPPGPCRIPLLELESDYDTVRPHKLWDWDVAVIWKSVPTIAGAKHLLKPSCEVEYHLLRTPSCLYPFPFPFPFHLSLPSVEGITKGHKSTCFCPKHSKSCWWTLICLGKDIMTHEIVFWHPKRPESCATKSPFGSDLWRDATISEARCCTNSFTLVAMWPDVAKDSPCCSK